MTKRALIVLSDGFEDVETVAPIDVLNRVGVEVVIASLRPGPVKGAYGTVMIAHTILAEVEGEFDAIICPGGLKNSESLGADVMLRERIREYQKKGKLVCAICAAPGYVLAESAEILRGRRATGDPGCNDMLVAAGAVVTGEAVTVDGNIVTGTGPGAALQFALTIARCLAGEDAVRSYAQRWQVEI